MEVILYGGFSLLSVREHFASSPLTVQRINLIFLLSSVTCALFPSLILLLYLSSLSCIVELTYWNQSWTNQGGYPWRCTLFLFCVESPWQFCESADSCNVFKWQFTWIFAWAFFSCLKNGIPFFWGTVYLLCPCRKQGITKSKRIKSVLNLPVWCIYIISVRTDLSWEKIYE